MTSEFNPNKAQNAIEVIPLFLSFTFPPGLTTHSPSQIEKQ